MVRGVWKLGLAVAAVLAVTSGTARAQSALAGIVKDTSGAQVGAVRAIVSDSLNPMNRPASNGTQADAKRLKEELEKALAEQRGRDRKADCRHRRG